MASTTLRTTALATLLTSAIGTVVLFLQFTWNVSPIQGLTGIVDRRVWMLALPFFLAPAMLYLAVQLIRADGASIVELRLLALLSLVIVLVTASFYVLNDSWPSSGQEWASFTTPLALVVGEAALLWRLWKRVPLDTLVLAALVSAYLPNATMCLIGFSGEWQMGAWVTIATVTGYVLTAGLIWRSPRALPSALRQTRQDGLE
jgi:hypothetical protein